MQDSDLRVDGNAGAGLLAEIFHTEMTVSWTTCGSCGSRGQIGTLHVYTQAPGWVFRCSGCGGVQMRIVRSRTGYFIDMAGVRALEIAADA